MIIAWLRSKPKPLVLLQRETQPLPREPEHAGPQPGTFSCRQLSSSPSLSGLLHSPSLSSPLTISKVVPLPVPVSRLLHSAGLEDSWVSMVGGRIWGSCEKYLWNFMNETGRLTASCHVGDVSHAGRRAT